MKRALLIGQEPEQPLGFDYVREAPYEAVVIGSLSLSELLYFRKEAALEALSEGMPVLLFTPGLPDGGQNRSLSAALSSARRQLSAFGIRFTDGEKHHLITAEEARSLRAAGIHPGKDARMTPLAREILEGTL